MRVVIYTSILEIEPRCEEKKAILMLNQKAILQMVYKFFAEYKWHRW
jgi:hypothetical protein